MAVYKAKAVLDSSAVMPIPVSKSLVPNEADAFNSVQARLNALDLDVLSRTAERYGVIAGIGDECLVTWAGTGLIFHVGSGEVSYGGRRVIIDINNSLISRLSLNPAHATLPRRDTIVATNLGNVEVRQGIADSSPQMAAVLPGDIPLAVIYVPAGETTSDPSRITDKRVMINIDLMTGKFGSLTVVGHSFVAGATQSDSGTSNVVQESCISKLQSLLGIHEHNTLHLGIAGSYLNGTVSGGNFAGWIGAFQYIWPSNSAVINAASDTVVTDPVVAVGGAAVIVHGTNDFTGSFANGATVANAQRAIQNRRAAEHAYRAIISRIRAGAVFCMQTVQGTLTMDSTVTTNNGSGSAWTNFALVTRNSGSGFRYQASPFGGTLTITLPTNFTGGTVAVVFHGTPSATTTLTSNINDSTTTIPVANRSEFPSSGTFVIRINNEEMVVTGGHGSGAGNFTVATRGGINGTSAAAHNSGDAVITAPDTARIDWSGTAKVSGNSDGNGTGVTYTATTLTDARRKWSKNQWVGDRVTSGSKTANIISNTSTSLVVDSWVGGTPSNGDNYSIGTFISGQGAMNSYVPIVKRFPCGPGDSGATIVATPVQQVSGDTGMVAAFDSWWIEAPSPPPIAVTNIHDFEYGNNFITDSTVSLVKPWNRMVERVVGEFDDYVKVADVHTPWWKRNGTLESGTGISGNAMQAGMGTSTSIVAGPPAELQDTSQNWVTDEWVGMTCTRTGSGSSFSITSNNSNTLFGSGGWTGGTPGNGQYSVDLGSFKYSRIRVSANDPSFVPTKGMALTFGRYTGEIVEIANSIQHPGVKGGFPVWELTVIRGRQGSTAATHSVGDWIGPMDWMHKDLIHINVKGHAVYAETLYRAFNSMPPPSTYQLAQMQGNYSQYHNQWHMGVIDNNYLPTPCSAITAGVTTVNKQYAIPIWIPRTSIIVEIGVAMTVVASGGTANTRFGIYHSDPSRARPGRLLQEFGSVNMTATPSDTKGLTGCYQVVRPGWYWLSCVNQGTASTQPTFRMYSANGLPFPTIMNSASQGASTAVTVLGISQASITGALADWSSSFTYETATGSVPRMYIRLRSSMFGV